MTLLPMLSIIFGVYAAYPWVRYILFRPYVKVPVRIVDAKIHHHVEGAKVVVDVYTVFASYEYDLEGVNFRSDEISFCGKPKYLTREKADEILRKINAAEFCYVSRRNHRTVTLFDSVCVGERNGRLAWMALSIILMVVYLWMYSGS
jgi:hypothetical protein